jgi:hypothetical protein
MTIFRITTESGNSYATEGAIVDNNYCNLAHNQKWQVYAWTDDECGKHMFCEGNITEVLGFVKNNDGEWFIKKVKSEPKGILSAMFANFERSYIIKKIDVNE